MPATASGAPRVSIEDEASYVRELLEGIVELCPRRMPTSDDERRAAEIIEGELSGLGLETQLQRFEHNTSTYANMALHFGLGSLGTLASGVAPHAAFAMHLAAAGSYYADSARRTHVLRRLLPYRPSQNVVATMPAAGEPALRVVFLAHLDAAYTGLLFDPRLLRRLHGPASARVPGLLKRSMALATYSQLALAGFDLLRILLGPATLPLRPLEYLLGVPGFVAFAANLQVVLRDEIVPGANDDLSGVVALPVLARRLGADKPANVELVFVATGCEEAGLGGADALARAHLDTWDRERTVVLGLDGLSNGELRLFDREGEITPMDAPAWLVSAARAVAAREARFSGVEGYEIPVGGTDVGAFLARGYDGLCLGCVDPELGAPRHYHLPADTPGNLDWDQILHCVDFAEGLVREVYALRLG